MADPITDAYSTLIGYLDEVEEIGIVAQVGVSLGLTLFFLLFTRYVVLSVAWRIVKKTCVMGQRNPRPNCKQGLRFRAIGRSGAHDDVDTR